MRVRSKERVVDMFVRGDSIKQISNRLGFPKSTIKSIILESI